MTTKVSIKHGMLVFDKDDLAVALMISDEACEGYPITISADLELVLAYIRAKEPALYMKGITSDMLIKYT